jgi:hypothetical protein
VNPKLCFSSSSSINCNNHLHVLSRSHRIRLGGLVDNPSGTFAGSIGAAQIAVGTGTGSDSLVDGLLL